MDDATAVDPVIATMPRGGPDASWLDRRLQTDALEYTDRYDVPDEVKQTVISALDRMDAHGSQHEKNARLALDMVADIPYPRILELGAGHAGSPRRSITCRRPPPSARLPTRPGWVGGFS